MSVFRYLLPVAAIAATGVPLLPHQAPAREAAFVWPARYEGQSLARIAATPVDRRLAADFPGQIARFSDGKRQVVLRHVAGATRRLHPARDCFHAIGYSIAPAPMHKAPDGALASCFDASRGGQTLRICEHIASADGQRFPDISAWYWSALLGQSQGPWLAAMTVARIG